MSYEDDENYRRYVKEQNYQRGDGSKQRCPRCKGTGKYPESDGSSGCRFGKGSSLNCDLCQGKGWI